MCPGYLATASRKSSNESLAGSLPGPWSGYADQTTRPRPAGTSAILARLDARYGAEAISSVGTPITVRSPVTAKPLARLRPTRNPVNEPGPIETATAFTAASSIPDCAISDSTAGNTLVVCCRPPGHECSANCDPSKSAIPAWSVAVSIARTHPRVLPGPNPSRSSR
jgi:hypothetical protein